MKKLVLSSLMTLLVSQAAGCIITSGEEDATILAQWSLKQQASNQIITCPPNITTAAVYSQEVDTSYRPIGQPIIDLYDCNDNSGRTAALAPSVYQVWVELTSEGGGTVHARSLSAFVDVIDEDKTFTTTLLNDGGYFQLDWSLVNSNTNAPMSCAEAAATGVGVISTLVSNQSTFKDDKFTCEDGTGITGGLLGGTYTVAVDAFDAGGSISPAPVNLTNKVIGDRNQVTDLGAVTIPVIP
jgi:hypothetical protein